MSSTPSHKPLSSQVGGHAGVLATEDGSLVIKPALQQELEFYQAVQHNPELAALRPFLPNFIGTLKLEGQLDQEKSAAERNISVVPIVSSQKDEL
ncbi:hypothetical protein H0H93_016240 [Arthromyces matolae]|nr:hypothetical protein H0H93_016240 [Arthromyces matolae]